MPVPDARRTGWQRRTTVRLKPTADTDSLVSAPPHSPKCGVATQENPAQGYVRGVLRLSRLTRRTDEIRRQPINSFVKASGPIVSGSASRSKRGVYPVFRYSCLASGWRGPVVR